MPKDFHKGSHPHYHNGAVFAVVKILQLVTTTPRHVTTTPRHVTTTPRHVTTTPRHVTTTNIKLLDFL